MGWEVDEVIPIHLFYYQTLGVLRLKLALVFPEEEVMMQQSSVSISLSF